MKMNSLGNRRQEVEASLLAACLILALALL